MKSKERLIEKLLEIHSLSEKAQHAFLDILTEFNFEKGTIFLKENQISEYFCFLFSGLVRIYYKKNEKEITEWIALDDEFFLSIGSFYEQKPSRLIMQSIEKSVIVGISYYKFMQLCSEYHEIETLHRKMITRSLLLSQDRMDSIQFETAHQRYEKLIQSRPSIIQRVPLTYIASFLGITLETLSRIRGK